MCTIFNLTGATLEIITDKSQEGAQFCKGFGGIGGRSPNVFFCHFFFKCPKALRNLLILYCQCLVHVVIYLHDIAACVS